MMRRRFADRCLLRLGRAEHGSAAAEFALITPVFMMLLMGSLDLAHQIYLRSVLSGATQVAARVSGLEDGSTTTADAAIQRIIAPVAPGAQVSISRQNYVSYSAVDVWESFTDTNGNGYCDAGEPYIDTSRNGAWTLAGATGQGGASDVVRFSVTVTYRSPFALPFLPALRNLRAMSAQFVRQNQPFGAQLIDAPVLNCV